MFAMYTRSCVSLMRAVFYDSLLFTPHVLFLPRLFCLSTHDLIDFRASHVVSLKPSSWYLRSETSRLEAPTQSHEASQRHLYLQFLVPPRKCQNVSDGAIDGIILRIFRLIGSSSGGVMSGSTFSIFHSERL